MALKADCLQIPFCAIQWATQNKSILSCAWQNQLSKRVPWETTFFSLCKMFLFPSAVTQLTEFQVSLTLVTLH